LDKIDEIDIYLNKFGLDSDEIFSVKSRNKYLKITLTEEIDEVLIFLQRQCKLNKSDIRSLVINNPFILTESMQRIRLLDSIYKKIGFNSKDYKRYLNSYDKAFSLNPRVVFEKIEKLAKSGKDKNDIKNIIIDNSYSLFY